MIKETNHISFNEGTFVYDDVDHFFTENGLADWRAGELALFTDAGFDVTDSAKQQVGLSEDGNSVVITVAYADQAEKDTILGNVTGDMPSGLIIEMSETHLF